MSRIDIAHTMDPTAATALLLGRCKLNFLYQVPGQLGAVDIDVYLPEHFGGLKSATSPSVYGGRGGCTAAQGAERRNERVQLIESSNRDAEHLHQLASTTHMRAEFCGKPPDRGMRWRWPRTVRKRFEATSGRISAVVVIACQRELRLRRGAKAGVADRKAGALIGPRNHDIGSGWIASTCNQAILEVEKRSSRNQGDFVNFSDNSVCRVEYLSLDHK